METFVVRVFVAAAREEIPLRGVVEHVASGSRDAFESFDRLIDVLESKLAAAQDLRDPAAIDRKGDAA